MSRKSLGEMLQNVTDAQARNVESLEAEISRLTKELEASRQETAKAREWAMLRAIVAVEAGIETPCVGDDASGGFRAENVALREAVVRVRAALKSNPESNTQGGEG